MGPPDKVIVYYVQIKRLLQITVENKAQNVKYYLNITFIHIPGHPISGHCHFGSDMIANDGTKYVKVQLWTIGNLELKQKEKLYICLNPFHRLDRCRICK